MKKLSKWIVDYRRWILVVAVLLLVPSAWATIHTQVNYDLLSYLPSQSEAIQVQNAMGDDFNLASVDMLVVKGMNDHQVIELKNKIKKVDGVAHILWKDDLVSTGVPNWALPTKVKQALYAKDSTLMVVTFKEDTASARTMKAIGRIKEITKHQAFLAGVSALSQDTMEMTNHDMPLYSLIAIAFVLIILFLGLESWVAPFVFMLGILFPVAYNFGTNLLLGKISYITQALAVVLQLAVTMDYSIFLLHRYQAEKKLHDDSAEAMANAIQATFVAISSSSVTTIAGFIALCAMQLTLGADIGLVMAKGVILGVLSTIIILPALLMAFDPLIDQYTHPILIHPLKRIPAFVVKHAKILFVVGIVIMVPMTYASLHTKSYYDLVSHMPQSFQSVQGTNYLKNDYGMATTHFVLVDADLDSGQTQHLIDDLKQVKGVKNVLSDRSMIGASVPNFALPKEVSEMLVKNHQRLMVVNSNYRPATDPMHQQIKDLNQVIHHYDRKGKIGGEGALTESLIETTKTDFARVNILSIVLIFVIIAITFKSLMLPVILVFTIELAININMGIPFFTQSTLPFIAGMVIGTIQLGATVDYAILLTTRFKEELSKHATRKEALEVAIAHSSPSILTSGLSFFAACIGVFFLAKMDLMRSLCELLARGALISVVAILLILPAYLLVLSPLIEKLSHGWPKGEN